MNQLKRHPKKIYTVMKTILVQDKEYQMATSFDGLNWSNYIALLNLESRREKYIVDLLYTQRFIEILSGVEEGTFDEAEIDVLVDLEPLITKGFDPALLSNIQSTTDHFIINGITYSFYSKNTIGKIKFNEQGYIEMLKMQSKERFDFLPFALATLIRPAVSITTPEGITKWKLEPFDVEDVEARAKILTDNLNVKDLIMVYNFFLTGATS